MELLLEFGESRRVLKLNEKEKRKDRIFDEMKKFGDKDLNSWIESKKEGSNSSSTYCLQSYSEKWQCYVAIDDDFKDLKDGDRISVVKSEVS